MMRHDYIYNPPSDPKLDDGLAKFFALLFWLVLSVVGIVYVASVVKEWINSSILWLTDAFTMIGSFWPF